MPTMSEGPKGRVRVEFPADTMNMVIARTVAAAMAARADLTVDQVEDVRLAMDEATAYAIKVALPGSAVRCDLWTQERTVHAIVECSIDQAPPPDPDPFAWTVLTALVNTAHLDVEDRTVRVQWSLTSDHSLHA